MCIFVFFAVYTLSIVFFIKYKDVSQIPEIIVIGCNNTNIPLNDSDWQMHVNKWLHTCKSSKLYENWTCIHDRNRIKLKAMKIFNKLLLATMDLCEIFRVLQRCDRHDCSCAWSDLFSKESLYLLISTSMGTYENWIY